MKSLAKLFHILAIGFSPYVSGSPTQVDNFTIIVHPSNAINEVDEKFLADIFLKKIVYWKNGDLVVPVDLFLESSTRRLFTLKILNRSVHAVRNYWQQMIFTGKGIQPLELPSEKKVIEYISKHPNSVGYVSNNSLNKTMKVKTLTVK